MTNGSTNHNSALETVLTGEASKLLHTHSATVLAKYGSLRKELEALQNAVNKHEEKISKLVRTAKKQLDPFYDRFDPTSKAGVEDLSIFRFIDNVGGSLINFMSNSSARLQMIQMYSDLLLPALQHKTSELSDIVLAEDSGSELIRTCSAEFQQTVLGFEKLLASIYVGTRGEYKKLRRKFLGGSAAPDNDNVEDQLLMSFFGTKPPQRETTGPATALIDENCVLTQLLIDIGENLPRFYEKVTPILKRGKLSGKTKTTKILDQGEIEDWAGTLTSISNPIYWKYVNNPGELTTTILSVVKAFQTEYTQIATALHALVMKANLEHEEKRRIIDDPAALTKQYNRINFLSIRPSAEDIAPRTKMDADLAAARTKLFVQLKETIDLLSQMDHHEQTTEDFAIDRVRKAIELKEAMDDIQRTEAQKHLKRNIADDNEFYVGKSGNLGSISSEREPAPRITYDDVIGASFIKAKQHVDEVIKVASHPHLMRLSAPRGNVKSNLLFIGPYGCGKTEIARAIGGDKRIIGFNVAVADMLTAYMHESVKNVKRVYDCAKDLRKGSRYTKPVAILMDEFDRLFNYGEGVHAAYDGGRMTGVLQEMMDGVVDYEGVFLVGMTNVPKQIPEAVLRRFKYVDVVGQLTQEERVKLFKMFLTRGLPVDESVTEADYLKWADMMNHAPGDVIGKVTDEIHFKFMHELVTRDEKIIATLEKSLSKKLRDREAKKTDYTFLKAALAKHKTIGAADITTALEAVIVQPQVKMQINKAKQTYKDAEDIMKGLSAIGESDHGFHGLKKSQIWGQ
jgi:SpoVK/Ycf46/Vps4 family AAA+-type ATPase